MKQCAYCGRENPDEASHCSECGTFLEPPKQTQQELKSPRRFLIPRDHLFIRCLIAVFVGLSICGISLKVAWRQSKDAITRLEQESALSHLDEIQKAVLDYQQKSNAFPENFGQLPFDFQGPWDALDYFKDYWGHPLVLSKNGTNCFVMSYGADGKPGGLGIDYDLTIQGGLPKESQLTFQQFWIHKRTRVMIHWCFICGAMAAFLSFRTVRVPDLTARGWRVLGLTLIATLVGTFMVTSVIVALHVPSGH